jgi:hypothetical protein
LESGEGKAVEAGVVEEKFSHDSTAGANSILFKLRATEYKHERMSWK